jgi:hypothetical protein
LFSRGSIADPTQPEILQSSGDPARFFLEVLNLDVYDVLRKFELWAVNQGESMDIVYSAMFSLTYDHESDATERENRNSLRSEVSKLVLKKLRKRYFIMANLCLSLYIGEATGHKNITMSYEKYNTMIVRQHYIRIHGWPAEIPFNVSKITSSADLRFLRDSLQQGAIRWVRLTAAEKQELLTSYPEERPTAAKRKARKSGKGTDQGGGSVRKRARKIISTAYISDDHVDNEVE